MKLRLLLSSFFCMLILSMYGQISIGLIGTATPGGWDVDTNMVQDPDSASLWTLDIMLEEGVVKFRANDNWDLNWGGYDFPAGIGEEGGQGNDIPVPYAGMYTITFDTSTLEYNFDIDSDISIIGSATPGGWDTDTEMYPDTGNVNGFRIEMDLVVGAAKFRKDMAWDVAWGADSFPSGIADTMTGGPDIPVDKAGRYYVTFDTLTGAYNFEEFIMFTSIGIVGDATPGGWDTDTELVQDSNDPNLWTGNIDLTAGKFKFRANGEWETSWGGPVEFPSDTAILGGDDIEIDSTQAGTYLVDFNTETGVFNFLPIVYYETIGIIGDAVDGWDAADRNMTRSETDSAQWNLRTILGDGEAKFRANDNWDEASWGGADFPTGIAGNPGVNMPVTAGEYIIDFNTTTGAYHFEEIVVYDTIGLVGTGTSIGDWDNDVYMNKDADDELLWTLTTDLVDGEIKFRAPTFNVDDPWAVNWGPEELGGWPAGIGIPFGANIQCVAGSYLISLRTDDGSYSFQDPSSLSESILKVVKIYPNPAENLINIELDTERKLGQVKVEILDVNGRMLLSSKQSAAQTLQVNVSSLTSGNYFVKIYNDDFLMAKPIAIIR